MAWQNRQKSSHQQERSTQEKYKLENFTGLVAGLFHQENHGMDEYSVEKSA